MCHSVHFFYKILIITPTNALSFIIHCSPTCFDLYRSSSGHHGTKGTPWYPDDDQWRSKHVGEHYIIKLIVHLLVWWLISNFTVLRVSCHESNNLKKKTWRKCLDLLHKKLIKFLIYTLHLSVTFQRFCTMPLVLDAKASECTRNAYEYLVARICTCTSAALS
jgi:hypothetical protein